jgi:hypothetical protein
LDVGYPCRRPRQFCKGIAVHELKRLARGELDGVPGEAVRGDQDATVRAFRRNHPE